MSGESYTNVLSGSAITPPNTGLYEATITGTVTLTNPAYRTMRLTASVTGLQLRLVPANALSVGENFIVTNAGSNAFDIYDNAGGTLVQATTGGAVYGVYLRDNATVSGSWQGFVFGGGGAAAGANSDITSLTGLTTPLGVAYGGTGSDLSTTTGSTLYIYQSTSGGVLSTLNLTGLASDLSLGVFATVLTWAG